MLIFILNILWFVLGGFFAGLGWILAGVIMAITIIGIPFAWAHVKLALASLFPIGKTVVDADEFRWLPGAGTSLKV